MVLRLCQRISISLSRESDPRWPRKHRRLYIPNLRLADNQAPGIKRSITGAMSHKMLSLTFALILLALSLSLATSNTAAQSRPRQVYPQGSHPSATRLRRAKPAKARSPVKQIAEPYLDRLHKLLTDYLRAIQTPK